MNLDSQHTAITMFNNVIFLNNKIFIGEENVQKVKLVRAIFHEGFGHEKRILGYS